MSKIVILGAGVIGLCSAYYAARRGHDVVVLERNPDDHPGCSFGNAGMIVPSHFVPLAAPGAVALGLRWMWNPQSPFWIKPRLNAELFQWALAFYRAATAENARRAAPILRDLHLASKTLFEQLAAITGNEFGLVTRGLLMLCKTPRGFEEESRAADMARALGVPATVLMPKQVAALEPALRMNIEGAVYFPNDCHLTPHLFMRSIKRLAADAGAKIVCGAEVRAIHHERAQIRAIFTNQGEFTGDDFVLCAGSWSAGLARQLDLKIPLQAGKGYSLTLEHPPQLPAICAILSEARVAVTPMGGSLRVGGTMEIAGLDEHINPVRVRGIINAIFRYLPDFQPSHFASARPWCGLRPCSPDGLPYLGRTRRAKNLVIATGHAMMGLSLGPVSGKLVAEILSGEVPSIDIQLLNPDRYG